MSKVIEITDQNFEQEVMNSDLPIEVDFWAPWCGPCRMVSPIYDKLAKEYDGRFKFCKLNVDENPQTAIKFQIMSIPMQLYFADGEKVDELLGAVPEEVIRQMVEGVLAQYPSDAAGRLKLLLSTWLEHNRHDSDKFAKWVKAAPSAQDSASADILEQARVVQAASDKLSESLAELQRQA